MPGSQTYIVGDLKEIHYCASENGINFWTLKWNLSKK
jgi:hypothetical protein